MSSTDRSLPKTGPSPGYGPGYGPGPGHQTALDLGLYAGADRAPLITGIEIIAAVLSVLWIGLVLLTDFGGDGSGPIGIITLVLTIVVPVALIWVAAMAARTARTLRQEAARLQAAIDAMRAAYVEQQQRHAIEVKPDLVQKLDDLVAAQAKAETQLATFTSQRREPAGPLRGGMTAGQVPDQARDQVLGQEPGPMPSEPTLDLAQPAHREPISAPDFIKALNFPENENDKEGFRTLRRALEDRATERLIRASQDVLTLLSQDGIYMDDLRPDRSKSEVWRRFAKGERGRPIAALGGIHDRSSLVLAAGRMRKDPVFRDAVHHFLRHFDRTFMEFEKNASDEEIAHLADTRTARAFMLLGRVTGTFD